MSTTSAYAPPALRGPIAKAAVIAFTGLALLAALLVITPGTSEATQEWTAPKADKCEIEAYDFPNGHGYLSSFGVGTYNLEGSLGWLNDDIESIWVPAGLYVDVSEHYDGSGWVKYLDGPGLFEVHDDEVSWIWVEGSCDGKKKGGELGDTVWFDENGDGEQNNGEPGIEGVTVLLRQGGVVVDTAVTDANGFYLFEDLDEGNWAVQVRANTLPAGLTQTFDADGVLNNRSVAFVPEGGSVLDQDFGYELLLGSIGDTVWLDEDGDATQNNGEAGIEGVTVLLRQNGSVIGTTTTDANGNYLFDELPGGRYAVQVLRSSLPANVAQTFDADGLLNNRSAWTLAPGENNVDQDFGYQPQIGNLGDTVWLDEDGDGTQNNGEAGIPNVTVLLRQGGAVVDSTVTDANGMYLFEGLRQGNWAVQVLASTLPDGLSQTYDSDGVLNNRSVTFVPAGGEDLDQDFGYRNLLGDLGDTVWYDADSSRVQDNGEAGIPNVTVLLRQGGIVIDSMVTDADGMYLFEDLVEGAYGVEIDVASLPANLIQTHDFSGALDNRSNVFVPGGGENLDQDFGYVEPPVGSIGDTVWLDADGDRTQNNGEVGIPNVTVRLRTGGAVVATAETDASGMYLFPGLDAGAYVVEIDTTTLPAGYVQTHDFSGGLDDRSAVTIAQGEDNLDQDFGYQEPAPLGSIGDFVWYDRNNSGTFDATPGVEDEPIEGAIVTLLDAAGTEISSTTTDVNGLYLFPNLELGLDYTVQVSGITAINPLYIPRVDLDGTLDNMSSTLLGDGGLNDDLRHDFGYVLEED